MKLKRLSKSQILKKFSNYNDGGDIKEFRSKKNNTNMILGIETNTIKVRMLLIM